MLEVLPDVFVPVASIGHLIALKALAGRHQDLTDLGYLISAATEADLDEARAAAIEIEERGFNRGQMTHRRVNAARRIGFTSHRSPPTGRQPTGSGGIVMRGMRACPRYC
jgi:hypothetical protein